MKTSSIKGVTLIELLVVIALVAILAGLAGPSFTYLVEQKRSYSLTNQFINATNLARSEAMTRGERVTICPIKYGSGDRSYTCKTNNNWSGDWLIFEEPDGSSIGKFESSKDGCTASKKSADTPCLERIVHNDPGKYVLAGGTDVSDYISFSSSGTPRRDVARGTISEKNAYFTMCIGNEFKSEKTRVINITKMGRITIGGYEDFSDEVKKCIEPSTGT